MNKQEYQKALKSPKWLTKRNRIKKRDKYKCTKCGCKDNLHVHHTYYLPNKMPWEVPDDCLITLCKVCHEKEHKDKDIKSFIKTTTLKKTEPIKRVSTKKKKVSPQKPKKLRFYKFMAMKSSTINQVFDKSTNWRKIIRPPDCVVKGFDDKKLAEKWLQEKPPQKEQKIPRVKIINKKLVVMKTIT